MLSILGVVFAIGLLSWMLGTILEDVFEAKWIKEFTKDFKDSVKYSQPSWDEIKEIASTRGLTQSKIQFTLRKFYREIITGRETDLLDHKLLIKGYIDKYREDEPFEGLPNEVRIHLEKVREQLAGNEHHLEPLTNQIKDLLTVNEKDRKYQRYYTIGSFFVGLAGLGLAAYTVLIQPDVREVTTSPVSQIESQQSANKAIQPNS
ncbi:MAG: hypothetical protein ACI9LM_004463 [Alteromonadaceae bacterium]|jgi:hypothetical protein